MAEADFQIIDERFARCVKTSAKVEKLFEGCRWAEGPAWLPAHRSLVWSDIPNDRMLRWDETTGFVGVFRAPAGYTNGHTVDRQGRLVSCEHGNRRVTRTEHDGSITVIADRYQGKRFNSPNGIAFSPDESQLFITDTGTKQTRHLRVFDVQANGTLKGGVLFATGTNGGFDGFRFDDEGRIWMSGGDGIHCLAPDGTLIGKVFVPEGVANVVFGGAKRNRLFICGTTSLYSVLLPVQGVKTF